MTNMPSEDEKPIARDTPVADPASVDEDWHVPYPLPGAQAGSVVEHARALFKVLEESCLFDEEEECHIFPTGKAFFICTNWANLTRRYFGENRTEVMGYLHVNNEISAISKQYEGHDFAVVDGRFIVDGWVTGVGLEQPGRATPGLYDMQDQDDAAEIVRLYGDKTAWELSGSSYAITEPTPF
jgi:hypothetical protein